MKIRLMGTPEQNKRFISLLRSLPELTIISESKSYPNRYSDIQERVYLEIQQDIHFTPAEVFGESSFKTKTNLYSIYANKQAQQLLEDCMRVYEGNPTTEKRI